MSDIRLGLRENRWQFLLLVVVNAFVGAMVGQALVRELRRREVPFVPLARAAFDYTSFERLLDYVRRLKPRSVI